MKLFLFLVAIMVLINVGLYRAASRSTAERRRRDGRRIVAHYLADEERSTR